MLARSWVRERGRSLRQHPSLQVWDYAVNGRILRAEGPGLQGLCSPGEPKVCRPRVQGVDEIV